MKFDSVSLKMKLTMGVVGAAALIAALVGAVSLGASEFGSRLHGLTDTSDALRRHTLADMMHDALRGDVYASLLAAEEEPHRKDEILSDTREHAAEFRKYLEENEKSAGLGDDVRKVLAEVHDPLEKYISKALGIVELAFSDHAKATAALQAFQADFVALETAMGEAGDRIEAAAHIEARHAQSLESTARQVSYAALALALPIIAALIFLILRRTIKPLIELEGVMQALALEKSDVSVPHSERTDEIGNIARSVLVFQAGLFERNRLHEAEAASRQADLERQKLLETQVLEFKNNIGRIVGNLGKQVGSMKDVANRLSSSASNASEQSSAASEASAGAADNSRAVAAATEELGASIREIATQAQQATSIVSGATEVSQRTNKDVERLAEATESIGSVVELIRKIAEQTNLLALNATIEAARAGDAGKGFAVVASEVKDLATQTAKATDEISRQILGVQSSSKEAAAAIKTVSSRVGEINGLTAAIAAAVEEQECATREIAQNVTVAADRSKLAAGNAEAVTQAAAETRSQAQSVGVAAEQLSVVSEEIEGALRKFVAELAVDLKNRRAEWRQPVNCPVKLIVAGNSVAATATEFCLHGLRVNARTNVREGERLTVEFGGETRSATVIHVTQQTVGLQFQAPFTEIPQCFVKKKSGSIAA